MPDKTDKSANVSLVNNANNKTVTVTTDINGTEHLDVNLIQDINVDPNNSSTANLGSLGVFTGTATSTLGIGCVQVNLKTDKKVTLSVQQSIDGTNWDLVDSITVTASNGVGRSFQATASYLRVVITNLEASATTFFRLQTILAPIIEALPRALTASGNLKVAILENTGSSFADQGKAWTHVIDGQTLTSGEKQE